MKANGDVTCVSEAAKAEATVEAIRLRTRRTDGGRSVGRTDGRMFTLWRLWSGTMCRLMSVLLCSYSSNFCSQAKDTLFETIILGQNFRMGLNSLFLRRLWCFKDYDEVMYLRIIWRWNSFRYMAKNINFEIFRTYRTFFIAIFSKKYLIIISKHV